MPQLTFRDRDFDYYDREYELMPDGRLLNTVTQEKTDLVNNGKIVLTYGNLQRLLLKAVEYSEYEQPEAVLEPVDEDPLDNEETLRLLGEEEDES